MKKVTLLFLLTLVILSSKAQQGFCDEIDYYFQQLTVNCRNIAGRVIPTVKEHISTRVLTGMSRGQCSGVQTYTNDFVKFYSRKFDTPEAADLLFQQMKQQLTACMKAESFSIESQATLDDGDKIIRWGKSVLKITKTIVLDLKPDAEGGFLVTVEMIISQ